MKKTSLLLALVTLTLGISSQAQTLTLLGSDYYTVDEGSTTAGYSQTASSLTFNGNFALGATLGGLFNSSLDWSGVTDFALTMSISGVNPQSGFTVEFYDSSVLETPLTAVIAKYEGSSSAAGASPTLVTMSLKELLNGNYNDVFGMQFTWDSLPQGAGSVTINSIDAVPEPSTWAMLIFGGLVVAGVMLRRRHLATVRR